MKRSKLIGTYQSPRWTGEIIDCSLPVTLDTYSNCSFGCVYCFSQYQRGVGAGKESYFSKEVKAINVEKLKKLFAGELPESSFTPWVEAKRPIQYGGLSDQFDEYEREFGKTYEVLKYLREIEYPICFSTKSTWVFFDERYRALFKGADNWNMKFSIITLDEKDAALIERGVDSPRKRLEAMREYTKLSKGGATLRLRPFIPGISDKTYLDLIREAHKAGATAVTTEFFCLDLRSTKFAKNHFDTISKCAGFDIVEFYRKYSEGSGYVRLNRKLKEKYIKNMKDLCAELGMRFYVSDAHFKEVSDGCCCCALPPTWDYSRGHFAQALQVAKKNGYVTWDDIEVDMAHLNFDWGRAEGYNTGSSEKRAKFEGFSMKDFLHYLWNNPSEGNSPYKAFGKVLVPDHRDEKGNIVYKFNYSVSIPIVPQ